MKSELKETRIKFYIEYLLSRRNHSEKELRDKILKKEYHDDALVDKWINKYKEIGYINDKFTTERLVENMHSQLYGQLKILQKCQLRGLNKDDVLIEIEKHDFFDTAYKFGLKNLRKYNLLDYKGLDKFKRKIVTRGFNYSIIAEIIDDLIGVYRDENV